MQTLKTVEKKSFHQSQFSSAFVNNRFCCFETKVLSRYFNFYHVQLTTFLINMKINDCNFDNQIFENAIAHNFPHIAMVVQYYFVQLLCKHLLCNVVDLQSLQICDVWVLSNN